MAIFATLSAEPASAQATPSVRIGTASLISPSSANTAYGAATTTTASVGPRLCPGDVNPIPAPCDDELTELAQALDGDPDKIYDFVRNNVATDWRYGVSKGALGALIDRSGTAFDQAELLVELTRRAGFTSSYRIGTITLSGAQFADWSGITNATAACQLLAAGGIPAIITPVGGNASTLADCAYGSANVSQIQLGHAWAYVRISGVSYVFDPAFKGYVRDAQPNLATAAGLTTGQVVSQTSAGMTSANQSSGGQSVPYVRNLNAEAMETRLDAYATSLDTYVQTNLSDGEIEDLVGGEEIARVDPAGGALRQTALPYASTIYRTIAYDFPNQYRTTLRVQMTKADSQPTVPDPVIVDKTFYVDDIYGRKLIFETSFTPLEGDTSGSLRLKDEFGTAITICGPDFPGTTCTFSSTTDNVGFNTGLITLTVNMPYIAGVDGANNTTGAYLDTTIVKNIDFAVPFTIVHGWGDMGRGLQDKWGTRLDTALRRPPADGCETCVSLYSTSTGDGRREQLAASWLTQANRAARLHSDIARAELVHHYSVGVAAAQTVVSGSNTNPPGAPTRYVYAVTDSYDRLDIDTALSLVSRTNDAVQRRATLHAIATTLAAIEGSTMQQVADLPDVSSTATRFAWGNRPPAAEDPSGGVGPRRFYRYSSTTASQALALSRTEGKTTTTDSGVWSGNSDPIIGSAEVTARRNQLANAISGFTGAGFDVIASEEAFLGPGQRAGALQLQPSGSYRHRASRQRGGAIVATRYVGSDPVQIAHVVNGPEGLDKGGGGGTQPNQASLYDPSTAADILKARFSDRSSALGVDVRTGSLTYESPAQLVVGSGEFPYQLTAQLFWRGGNIQSERFGPASHVEPQAPWSTNWNNTLAISSSGLEAMGDTDIRAAVPTVAAFLALQDVYKSAVSAQREVIGAMVADWWTRRILGNVVTASVGAQTRQFLKRANGTWFSPGTESYATLTQTGARSIIAEKPSCDQNVPLYVGTRGFSNTGMAFALRNGEGDTQNFGAWEYNAIDGQSSYCARQQGFRLNTWTWPQGVSLTFSYATQDFAPDTLTQVQNSLGRRIVFVDSGLGGFNNGLTSTNLRSVAVNAVGGGTVEHVDPNGEATRFVTGLRGERHQLREVFTPDAPTVPSLRYEYDTLNRVNAAWDATALRDGTRGPYVFRVADGVRGEREDPEGGEYEVLYDLDDRPFRFIDEIGRTTTAGYDGRGRVTGYTYPEGDRQTMVYNDRNQITRMTSIARTGSSLANLVVEAGWNTTWNKPAWIDDALDRRTDFSYHASGAGAGLVSQVQRPAPVGTTPRPVYGYSYTAAGLLQQETDPTGRITTHGYNGTGDRTTTTVGVAAVGGPALNLVTTYGYNTRGELTSVRDPRLHATTYLYDNMRRKTEEARRTGSITGVPLTMTRWTYDEVGRPIEERRASAFSGSSPTAFQTWLTEYTPTGQVRSTTDPAGDVTRMEYDGVDRLEQTVDPTFRVSRNVYDLAGQLLQERQAVGTPLEQAYATYTYDDNGQRTSITDARNNAVALTYDGFDRPDRITFPDATYEQQTYDAVGNVIWTRTREGLRIRQDYDRLDRKTFEGGFRPDGTTPARNVEPWRMPDGTFGYDLAGRMTSANNTNVNLSWTYDAAGRALTHVRSVGGTFGYGWDGASNLQTLTYPDSRQATYGFDAANRMTSAALAGGSATLAYDALGRRQSITFGDNSTQTYAYETDDDLLSIAHVFPAGTSNNVTETFVHDAAGRTTSETYSNTAYRWTPPAGTTPYAVADALNRYPSVGGQVFTWWGDGSLKSNGSRQFQYDERRNMVTATDMAGSSVRAQSFDARGQRNWAQLVRPGVTGEATRYFTDGLRPEVVVETLQSQPAGGGATWPTTIGSRLHALGPAADERLITVDTNNTVRYPHTDARGSTIALSAAGTMALRIRYDAYGVSPDTMTFGTGASAYPWRYTGQAWDQFASLYHYKAREYAPTLGRFLQPDPAGFVDGPNLYSYVSNSPVYATDPAGQQQATTCGRTGASSCSGQYSLSSAIGGARDFARGAAESLVEYGLEVGSSFVLGADLDVQLADAGSDEQNAGRVAGRYAPDVAMAATPAGAARSSALAVPRLLARIVPRGTPLSMLGRPGSRDVFVTAADDIAGMNATQIAARLAIPESPTGFTVIVFRTPNRGLATPINRTNPQFVGRGRTAGGAREYVVPQQPIPPGSRIRHVE